MQNNKNYANTYICMHILHHNTYYIYYAKNLLFEDGLSQFQTKVGLNLRVLDCRFEHLLLKVSSGLKKKFIARYPASSLKDPFQVKLKWFPFGIENLCKICLVEAIVRSGPEDAQSVGMP